MLCLTILYREPLAHHPPKLQPPNQLNQPPKLPPHRHPEELNHHRHHLDLELARGQVFLLFVCWATMIIDRSTLINQNSIIPLTRDPHISIPNTQVASGQIFAALVLSARSWSNTALKITASTNESIPSINSHQIRSSRAAHTLSSEDVSGNIPESRSVNASMSLESHHA